MRDVYEEFRTTVMPYSRGNIHPRFWGWANGSGVPVAAYADLLASVVNNTLGSGENAAMMVEHQVLEWLKEAMHWSADGSGILTSGASVGQIIALAAARRAKSAAADIRGLGAVAEREEDLWSMSTARSAPSRSCCPPTGPCWRG
jgi:glutamate/tyrosine decarboxylase-like PLP-dependent enzyme